MADGYSGLSSPNVELRFAAANTGDPTVDATTTGDKVHCYITSKCVVVRFGVLLNATPGDAGAIDFDKRILYASDTGRVDKAVGTINLTTSHVAGNIVYKDPTTQIELQPGDEVVVEVTDASASVTEARAYMIVREVPEVAANQTDMKLSA